MSTPEVVVVGGRVAGSSTALLLSRLGHQVVLIDRADPATDTLSTHALMRTGVLQLQRWGLLDEVIAVGTPPIRQITLGFGEQKFPFDFRDEYGVDALYAPRRHILDGMLVEAARKAGAEIRLGQRAVGATRDSSGRVDGVVVDDGGKDKAISARFVVGADGVYSKMAGFLGARTERFHQPQNTALYGYYAGVEANGYEFQFTPGYNVGVIPTNDGLTNVFASFAKRPIDSTTEEAFWAALRVADPELESRVAAGTRVGTFRRTPGIPGFIKQPHGPGWVLVGDAGFTKDPISAHGISDALRDAELAALAVHQALTFPGTEREAMERYQQDRDRFAIPLYEESRILSAYGWDPAEASMRLRTMSSITDAECRFLSELGAVPTAAAAA